MINEIVDSKDVDVKNESTDDVAPDYKGPQPDYLNATHKSGGQNKVLNDDGSLPPLPDKDVYGSGALDGNTTQ